MTWWQEKVAEALALRDGGAEVSQPDGHPLWVKTPTGAYGVLPDGNWARAPEPKQRVILGTFDQLMAEVYG